MTADCGLRTGYKTRIEGRDKTWTKHCGLGTVFCLQAGEILRLDKKAEFYVLVYSPKERTNIGKQTVAFSASVLWDDIPVDLKNLSAVRATF